MFVNSDFSDLLSIFNHNNVKYMVIGGYAVVQYTEPRYTKDLDIWIAANPTNGKAVYQSLKEFAAPLRGLTEQDFSQEGYFYQMGVAPVRVDILMGLSGFDFEDAWSRRLEVDFDGLLVSFISRGDLIQIKRSAGRPQDLIDVELLSHNENG